MTKRTKGSSRDLRRGKRNGVPDQEECTTLHFPIPLKFTSKLRLLFSRKPLDVVCYVYTLKKVTVTKSTVISLVNGKTLETIKPKISPETLVQNPGALSDIK